MSIRKRMISPEIWEDPSFNKLSMPARLLFVGMISSADDEGYLRGDSGSLKRLIFGFDEKPKIEEWIEELNNFKNIHFYESNGEVFAHLLNWDKYQKQQKDRILRSCYPKCSKCYTNAKQVLKEVSKQVSKVSKQDGLNKLRNELVKKKIMN